MRTRLISIIVLLLIVFVTSCENKSKAVEKGNLEECIVEKVIDGDTIVCSGKKVRLIGIDTPESTVNPHIKKQRALGDVETILRLGQEAKKFTERLMPPGTKVKLEYDVEKFDRYGRTLAYVWLPDGRMANEVIIREGYAMLLTIPPNVKYEKRFREAFHKAVEEKRGLWKD